MTVDHLFGRTLRRVDNVVLAIPTKQFSVAIDKVPFVTTALEPFLSLQAPIFVIGSRVHQTVFVTQLVGSNFLVGLRLVEHALVLQRLLTNLAYQINECWIAFLAPRTTDNRELVAEKVLAELGQLLRLGIVGRQPVSHIVLHIGQCQLGSTKRKRQQEKHRTQQQHCDAANEGYRDREKTFDHRN